MDDVLAALDVHTAKWVVEEALQGDLIENRTVLLVTHNVALAAPIADHVVLLRKDGRLAMQGSINDVLNQDSKLRAQVEKERKKVEDVVEVKLNEGADDKDQKSKAGKLVLEEEKQMGRVEKAAMMLFIDGMGGMLGFTIVLATVLVAALMSIATTWFIGYWSSQYETHNSSEVPVLK